MILIIDNYDSFTYNLVQYLGELLLKDGKNPETDIKVVRNDQITLDEIEKLKPSKILISPGPCTPKEAGISVPLINKFAGVFPILGVCLGHQAIGAAFGGNIIRAPQIMHGKTSLIHHDGRTIFKNLSNPFVATRYHSLIIEKESCPSDLEISAWTEEGMIMGVRHKKFQLEGVQFHPESILTTEGKNLLKNFLSLQDLTI
jgi:anthranilate synthase/aminodeoxychorismate synthase-like glutamine amidotransferase